MIDCVLKGEGEISVPKLLLAVEHDRKAITKVPGVVSLDGDGPPPQFVENLDDVRPARDSVCQLSVPGYGVLTLMFTISGISKHHFRIVSNRF